MRAYAVAALLLAARAACLIERWPTVIVLDESRPLDAYAPSEAELYRFVINGRKFVCGHGLGAAAAGHSPSDEDGPPFWPETAAYSTIGDDGAAEEADSDQCGAWFWAPAAREARWLLAGRLAFLDDRCIAVGGSSPPLPALETPGARPKPRAPDQVRMCPARSLEIGTGEPMMLHVPGRDEVRADGSVRQVFASHSGGEAVVDFACDLANRSGRFVDSGRGPTAGIAGNAAGFGRAAPAVSVVGPGRRFTFYGPQFCDWASLDEESVSALLTDLEGECMRYSTNFGDRSYEFCYPDSFIAWTPTEGEGGKANMTLIGALPAGVYRRPGVPWPPLNLMFPQLRRRQFEELRAAARPTPTSPPPPPAAAAVTALWGAPAPRREAGFGPAAALRPGAPAVFSGSLPVDLVPQPVGAGLADLEVTPDPQHARNVRGEWPWAVRLQMTNGGSCAAGGSRRVGNFALPARFRTTVFFVCPEPFYQQPAPRLVSVREVASCVFEAVVHTALVCAHPRILPARPPGPATSVCVPETAADVPGPPAPVLDRLFPFAERRPRWRRGRALQLPARRALTASVARRLRRSKQQLPDVIDHAVLVGGEERGGATGYFGFGEYARIRSGVGGGAGGGAEGGAGGGAGGGAEGGVKSTAASLVATENAVAVASGSAAGSGAGSGAALFRLGQVLWHSRLSLRVVVIGWDARCLAPPAWRDDFRAAYPEVSLDQPFYLVLADMHKIDGPNPGPGGADGGGAGRSVADFPAEGVSASGGENNPPRESAAELFSRLLGDYRFLMAAEEEADADAQNGGEAAAASDAPASDAAASDVPIPPVQDTLLYCPQAFLRPAARPERFWNPGAGEYFAGFQRAKSGPGPGFAVDLSKPRGARLKTLFPEDV